MGDAILIIYAPTLVILVVIGVVCYKFAWFTKATYALNEVIGRIVSWLGNPELAYGNLVEILPYRDFYEDVIETNQFLWAGLEIDPISTDGYDNSQWNSLQERLSRCLTVLPDETAVQVICKVENNAGPGTAVLRRMLDKCPHPALRQVLLCRIDALQQKEELGRVKTLKTHIYFGRPIKDKNDFTGIKSYILSSEFENLEKNAFTNLANEVLRTRTSFGSTYQGLGGKVWKVKSAVAFAQAYEKLNPKRSKKHPVPSLVYYPIESDRVTKGEKLNAAAVKERETLNRFYTQSSLFSDSPRETLVFGDIEKTDKGYLLVDDIPTQTISIQKPHIKSFAGLLQFLTRSSGLNFNYEVCTNFIIGDQYAWDDKLEKMQEKAEDRYNEDAGKGRTNLKQASKGKEIYQIRQKLRSGDEKIGELGFHVTFQAADTEELYERRDQTLTALRTLEGLEGIAEAHVPVGQYLATLPAGDPTKDKRMKPCLVSHAVGLMPLTGAASGVDQDDAIEVLDQADGSLFLWNQFARFFDNGMAALCGGPGSGKSGLLNRFRTSLLASGRRGVSFDFGASSARICELVDGNLIIMGSQNSAGLGLLDIWVKEGEIYEPGELNENNIPFEGIRHVTKLIEYICLDPNRPGETSLDAKKIAFIEKSVTEVYTNLRNGEIPDVEMFIDTFRLAKRSERSEGEEIAARLKMFASDGSYGQLLNDPSPPPSANSLYTVFDFSKINHDPRLRMLGALGASLYLERMLRTDPHIGKFFDVDELNQLAKDPLIRQVISDSFRTARKRNCIITAAGQDPEDFINKEMAGIRAGSEIKILLRTNSIKLTKDTFELTDGEAELLKEISTQANQSFKDCLLKYPGGKVAHIRLEHGVIDRRLMLGAGRELATMKESEAVLRRVLGGEKPAPSLLRALEMKASGAKN